MKTDKLWIADQKNIHGYHKTIIKNFEQRFSCQIPQKVNLLRAICRQQAAIHLEGVEEISQSYYFINHQKFLQKNIIAKSETKILIFATTSSLQVLGIGSGWLADSTSEVVPSIHSALHYSQLY